MLRLLLLALVVAFFAVIGAAVAAYAWFGVLGAAAVGVLTLVAVPITVKLLGGKLFARLVRLPFKAKGAPLRDAKTRLHAVRRANPPADRSEEDGPREWFVIELTITPTQTEPGAFQGWAPGELLFVAPDASPEDVSDDDEWGGVHKVRVWEEPAGWRDADEAALVGEQRVRMLVGLRPGAPRLLRLRYYFELFGRVDLARARQAG